MSANRLGYLCEKSFHLHRMNDHDDLNLYYRKFLNKLSKISLKIFLPILSLLYLFALFLCRCFLLNPTGVTFDLRTILYLIGIFFTFILLFLVRLHTKWRTVWFFTRLLLIFLLIIPLILTFQTEQFHILFSTISITLIYSLCTFTLIQCATISLSISILHLVLFCNQTPSNHRWPTWEIFSLIFYHFIINLAGLISYTQSIRHIREHFHSYENHLYEKNKFTVDCKKLNTILSHCQQNSRVNGRLSKYSHAFNLNHSSNVNHRRYGTVLNCNLSLNEQTRLHTSDELASLIDVLFCQIEQLIVKQQAQAKYLFDNETIVIVLLNENENESINIDQTCRLAIELFRFIQHVNQVTQWSLTAIIGIDYNELLMFNSENFQGLATDYSRWLREECLIINRIHVSSRIYNALKENKFYEFHSYSWPTNKISLENNSTYFLFSTNMYEPLNSLATSMNNSSMIDQLTRIQAQYHVEKHLGTITLTRSLRKRSLIELTTKHLYWSTLKFKQPFMTVETDNLNEDFQRTHRATRPNRYFYLFIIFILIASLFQSIVIDHLTLFYFISFPSIIVGLILIVSLFLYSIRNDENSTKLSQRKFAVYLNVLICLTFCTVFLVATQYHAIWNFKYLFDSTSSSTINQTLMEMSMNFSSSQMNSTWNFDPLDSFDRRYHDYLVLSSIFPLYLCSLYRQCSWMMKTFFILSCLIVQMCLFEYIWLTTHLYFPSIHPLHHYTTMTLIIFHGLLLIISVYVREWLEKIDFVWLKRIDQERLIAVRQREDLIKQTSSFLPLRVIDFYLRTDSDLALSQHYHQQYDRMALLYLRFHPVSSEHQFLLMDFLHDIEYLLKNTEKYAQIVFHRKATNKEILFSVDLHQQDPMKSLQQLVELLFQLDERLKQLSSSTIDLSACLHIGNVQEILIHLEKYPKIDLWSEHIALLQVLMSKTQANHCLTSASVYHLLNDLYLFRTAGSIVNPMNNSNIYYLLGRLIGDNVFQGRNALPLTIGHNHIDTVQKSSTTDESQHSNSSQLRSKLNCQKEQNQIQTSTTTTTTTSSSVVLNEQKSLLKQSSSRKHVRISNHLAAMENPSYRHTLLQALNGTNNHQQQISPMKKISGRLTTKKHTPPPLVKETFVPRMIHLSDNSCWSSREAMTQSETSGSKCLILTQKMINGSNDDNSQCRSTPPPTPLVSTVPVPNFRQLSSERKSFTEEDFRQLLHEQSTKENNNVSRSLSTTNEETASSFSGWDEIPPSPLTSIKSNPGKTTTSDANKPKSPSPPIIDCYYPRRPCDLSFTVNMTTTEDETSSRTETKSTVVVSPSSTVITLTAPEPVVATPVNIVPAPPVPSQPQQVQMSRYRPVPFNLARKLIAETSESALSEISVEHQDEPWTQNIVYQSRQPQRTRLSSSYNNLHDLLQINESSKYLPNQNPTSTVIHSDLLQRWLEDQLHLFQCQIKQTPPLSTNRKNNRYSTNVILKNDSTDEESDTVSENTFTTRTNPQAKSAAAVTKRPYNHVRYKQLRRNSSNTSHLIRHESLKYRNRPLMFESNPTFNKPQHHSYASNHLKKYPRRTDSSSMPRSDLSDFSSSRPDNLSESVISNLESEYDNIYTEPISSNAAVTLMNTSQILSDDEDDDDDDETTLATTIAAPSKTRCYF